MASRMRSLSRSDSPRPAGSALKKVLRDRLSPQNVALIVKAYAKRLGLDPSAFSGHSLRAGFLTSAAARGASLFKMMEVSRHKSVDTLRGYVRDCCDSQIALGALASPATGPPQEQAAGSVCEHHLASCRMESCRIPRVKKEVQLLMD
jgi:hypothetical protein